MSGTTHFYIPAEGHSNDDIFQSNDDLHTQINNKPHYTEYFPKMDFKKGKLDLKESAIEENIVKPLQPIGNFVNKIRGKSGHYSINNDF